MTTNWETVKMGDSSLTLHCGARKATFDDVTGVVTPDPTDTWVPVPHARVIEEVSESLERAGLSVKESAFSLYQEGKRFFGLLGLDAGGGEGGNAYQLVVGLRNSHDRSFPVGLVVGSRVFVCDNLAFSSEITVTRRHTRNVMNDLPRLIATACGMIQYAAGTQERRFNHYRESQLTDMQAHDLLVQSLGIGAIGSTTLPKVLGEWREPRHNEFKEGGFTAWRLWNAYTEVFKGYDEQKLPRRTIALQGLFDVYTRFQASRPDADVVDAEPALAL